MAQGSRMSTCTMLGCTDVSLRATVTAARATLCAAAALQSVYPHSPTLRQHRNALTLPRQLLRATVRVRLADSVKEVLVNRWCARVLLAVVPSSVSRRTVERLIC
jgi:hypothetical protein